MTASELKYLLRDTQPHFFTRDTMRFFGDSMRNYGVRTAEVKTRYLDGSFGYVECWELYRKRPVKHGLQDSAYFDKSDLERVFPAT